MRYFTTKGFFVRFVVNALTVRHCNSLKGEHGYRR